MCNLLLLDEVVYVFNYIHLIDSVVEFNYVLANFLQPNLSISGSRLLISSSIILD